jgi:uncharacterized protein
MELLSVESRSPRQSASSSGRRTSSTVEDLHEALVGAVPGIRFGLAFCEASGKWLVRWSGTDPAMIEVAKSNAPRSARDRFWRSLLPAPGISRSPLR